jgi:vesicle coat complex subunit
MGGADAVEPLIRTLALHFISDGRQEEVIYIFTHTHIHTHTHTHTYITCIHAYIHIYV